SGVARGGDALLGRLRGRANLHAVTGCRLGENGEQVFRRRTEVGPSSRTGVDTFQNGGELLRCELSEACGHAPIVCAPSATMREQVRAGARSASAGTSRCRT